MILTCWRCVPNMQNRRRSPRNTSTPFLLFLPLATLAFTVLVAFSFLEPDMQNRTDRNRITSTGAIVADIVSQLDDDLREDFEERAGIIEFEAKVPRAHAEALALIDVLRRHPEVLIKAAESEVRSGTAQT